jgi:hypothetical protein
MDDTLVTTASSIRKGRSGIVPGQYPALVTYNVPVSTRKWRKKNPKTGRIEVQEVKTGGYTKTSPRWKWPAHILRDGDELDEEKMAELKLTFPGPEDPNRMHIHDGIKGADGKLKEHPVSKHHTAIYTDIDHRDEIDEYLRLWSTKRASGTKQKQYAETWVDKYNVTFKQLSKVVDPDNDEDKLGNEFVKIADDNAVTKYEFKEGIPPMFLFERTDLVGKLTVHLAVLEPIKFRSKEKAQTVAIMIAPAKKPRNVTVVTYDRVNEAVNAIKNFLSVYYTRKKLRKSIEDSLDIAKSFILKEPDTTMLSEYRSGENALSFTGNNGLFSVKMNNAEILGTDSFRNALSKYYSFMHKIIRSEVEDKDMALELLGDHVVLNNRKIMPMLAKLGSEEGVKFLKEFDYDELEVFIKYEPQVGIVQGVPTPEDQDGAGEGGRKVGRKDLTKDDLKVERVSRLEQQPIEEEPFFKEGMDTIGMPVKPEEDVPGKEPPQRPIHDSVVRRDHEPIIGKAFTSEAIEVMMNLKKMLLKAFTDKDAHELGKKLNIDWSQIDIDQFKVGMKEELEHRDVTDGDPVVTAKIVLAHFKENKDYYNKLKRAGLIGD